jgi:rhamnogalacturonyl hydrolase YesR
MSPVDKIRRRLNPQRIASLTRQLVVVSLIAAPMSCGTDPGTGAGSVAGASGSSTTFPPGAGGSSAGSSATQGGSAGAATQTGGMPSAAGTASATTGGTGGSGGTAAGGAGTAGQPPSTGGAAPAACSFTCVDQCAAPATPRDGTCAGTQVCCEDTQTQTNPLAHLAPSAKTIGLLLANRFANQTVSYTAKNIPGDGYKTACEWYGALGIAKLTSSQDLLTKLVTKFDPFKATFVADMTGGDAHVDRYIYGIVPLEIYIQTKDASYLPLGVDVAKKQKDNDQTRGAIDDMFMMTSLQVQAYRALKLTPERASEADAYIDYMAKTMVTYLSKQKDNGLFFHNDAEGPVHWGRGNGWFAAGMAEIMRDLPKTNANYATIEAGYKKMMDGLVKVQGTTGLWYQVLDKTTDSKNWYETSGSAMFTYALIAGVKRGLLDAATYVPVVDKAWAGLQTKISMTTGDVSDICVGTWYKATAADYMALTRLTGDGHGQAPVQWAAAELLR